MTVRIVRSQVYVEPFRVEKKRARENQIHVFPSLANRTQTAEVVLVVGRLAGILVVHLQELVRVPAKRTMIANTVMRLKEHVSHLVQGLVSAINPVMPTKHTSPPNDSSKHSSPGIYEDLA